ncbi:MAG TPA: hypothetical protein VG164_03135 [Trebonia sp.]|jgi:hypothetical protein|nr:hypothetical protein [Trebonia sp.]
MDKITSGHSAKVLAWLEARGVGAAVAAYAMDEATRCDLGDECPDGCGELDGYTVTFDTGAGKWTARSNTGRTALDTWTVFSSSGEYSYTADGAALAIAAHEAKHPGDFVQVVISDACPASVTTANLIANQ